MKKKGQTLTQTEFLLMTILWDIGHAACAWDILERWEEPKPAYTTVATYLKVLRETRAEYTRQTMQEVKRNFFDGSLKKMLSFFVREEHLTAEEIQELLEEMEA